MVGRADGRTVGRTVIAVWGLAAPTFQSLTRLTRLTKNRHALTSWVVFQGDLAAFAYMFKTKSFIRNI